MKALLLASFAALLIQASDAEACGPLPTDVGQVAITSAFNFGNVIVNGPAAVAMIRLLSQSGPAIPGADESKIYTGKNITCVELGETSGGQTTCSFSMDSEGNIDPEHKPLPKPGISVGN